MVVANEEGLDKSEYRKFNIKNAQTNDDFAMMNEVIERRFKKIEKSNNNILPKYNSIIIYING